MRLAVGADHAGFEMKESLAARLRDEGHEVIDVGAHEKAPLDDYPDFAEAVGRSVIDGRAERGILVCGSGVGASIAANKVPGVRAGLCHDLYSAAQGVEHDDMNVLVLGARVVELKLAEQLVEAFLGATFSGDERHVRRVGKVGALEKKYMKPGG